MKFKRFWPGALYRPSSKPNLFETFEWNGQQSFPTMITSVSCLAMFFLWVIYLPDRLPCHCSTWMPKRAHVTSTGDQLEEPSGCLSVFHDPRVRAAQGLAIVWRSWESCIRFDHPTSRIHSLKLPRLWLGKLAYFVSQNVLEQFRKYRFFLSSLLRKRRTRSVMNWWSQWIRCIRQQGSYA